MNFGLGLSQISALALTGALAGVACDPSSVPANEPGVDARGACDYTPAPRWVLRDKDGQRVQALVEPRCGQGSNASADSRCLPLDFGTSSSFPCVRVIDHDGRYINILYELTTGLIEPCQGGLDGELDSEWKKDRNARYLQPGCEGDPYAVLGEEGSFSPESLNGRSVRYVEGNFWYLSESSCVERDTSHWQWNSFDQKCVEVLPPYIPALCVFRPTPEWVHTLLPNPPYTIAVEYD